MKQKRSNRVSVVVPTYNQAQYLPLALDSILGQTYGDWEAIVVNDGSTDNTASIADDFARRDPRFKVIHKENGGISSALNAGLAEVTGGYFCWLSSDDMYLPGKLEAQIRAFDTTHRKAGIVVSGYQNIDPSGQVTGTFVANPEAVGHPEANLVLHGNFINGCTIMVPMDVIKRVGPFSTRYRYAQDYDMWTRICLRYPIAWLDEVLVAYRVHPEQGSATQVPDCLMDSYVIIHEILRRHSLEEVAQGFSLGTDEAVGRTLDYVLCSVLWEHSWINSQPLNEVFWEWFAGNLKRRFPDQDVIQILGMMVQEIRAQGAHPVVLGNLDSISAAARSLASMAPFRPVRAATNTSAESGKPGPAAKGTKRKADRKRIAFTIVDGGVRGGGAIVLYRYVNWLGALGVEVGIYSDKPPPTWIELDASFSTVPDWDQRYSSITEPIVVLYSALEILPALRNDNQGKRFCHLCQGYEGFHYGTTYAERMQEKPYFDFLHRLPMTRIAVSEHLRELFRKKANEPVHVIPNGVDLRVFFPRTMLPAGDEMRVLVVGDPTSPAKGIQDLERALAIVAAANPEWRLVLDIACAHGVSHPAPSGAGFREEMAEALTADAMRERYHSAAVVVCPSWYEGFGLPAAEAMACGVPLITADNQGTNGFCTSEEDCLVVPANDPKSLAGAIQRLLADEDLRTRLAERGLSTIQEFSMRHQFDRFVPVFQDILGTRFDADKVERLRSMLA
ncbi:MAG: glycosyltransferase [Coriobacteriia bacterium]